VFNKETYVFRNDTIRWDDLRKTENIQVRNSSGVPVIRTE
jgi:hypothetical protein